MKEKIERFSKGDFEYELPFLCLSEDEIRITVEAGKIFEGSFTVKNSAEGIVSGVIYSSSRLLKLKAASFSGADNLMIYAFHATDLKEGEELRGELAIVSDCGEKTLPFEARIEAPCVMTSLGRIRDLFQFASLARADWSEAKRVFRREDFEHIFLEKEDRDRVLYRQLLKSISTSQALEEFLIAVHEKSMLRLAIDRTSVEYDVRSDSINDHLLLTKDHWGYAEIKVTTDAAFVILEQKFVWADRFIGNTYQIAYTVSPEHLRPGNNYGHLWIKTACQTITVDIFCRYKASESRGLSGSRRGERLEYGFTADYLDYRLDRVTAGEYGKKLEEKLLRNPEYASGRRGELMRAQLAVSTGRSRLADELLSDLEAAVPMMRRQPDFEYFAYLFLRTLYHREEAAVLQAVEEMRLRYLTGGGDWRILWFLLNIDKSYEKNVSDKLKDIREQFDMGCRSPLLYLEAVRTYNQNPALLRELADFEIQVLNYGIKQSIASKELVFHYIYLAGKYKSFHPVIYRGLVRLYREYGGQDVLSAICSLLIKGARKSEKYHEWYRLGVEARLRITELYEYYMYSISFGERGPVAQPVLLYFIYNSSLNDRKKAFLYANIVVHKEGNEAIYRSYFKRMEVFAAKMLEAHIISRDLSVLYREFLHKNALTPEQAGHLPYVMYRHELVCDNPNIVSVTVIHKELGMEENRPLAEGCAQVDIFTGDAQLFLTDSLGNRYAETIDYTLAPYLNPEDYEAGCLGCSNHPMLLLHLFYRYQSSHVLDGKSITLRKQVLQLDSLDKGSRNDCCGTLIDYCYENKDAEGLEYCFAQLGMSELKADRRAKYLDIMVEMALYPQALEVLEAFGYEGVSTGRLLKLCSGWLGSGERQKNELVLDLCHEVFRHDKYDEASLEYLVAYYEGPTGEMYRLWKAAKGFELDPHTLEERLLTQMLFGEGYIEGSIDVFTEYYKNVTNPMLVRGFLSYLAYHYLVHLRALPPEIFLIMKRELSYEENEVCLIAWLKANRDNREMTRADLDFAEYQIERLVNKGISLRIFTEYGNRVRLPRQLRNRSFLTYIADPQKQVYIHFHRSGQEEQDYSTERMPNVFLGIHVKTFLLFYRETVQYYITEESTEESNVTEILPLRREDGAAHLKGGVLRREDGELHPSDEAPGEEDSHFHQINLMLMALERKDDEALLSLMENYIVKEAMLDTCFMPVTDREGVDPVPMSWRR